LPTLELKKNTLTSVLWTTMRIIAGTITSFLVFLVLARLLSPSDFGVFALSVLFADFFRLIATAGLPDAVLRENDLDEELADTAFWSCVGSSTIFAVFICLVASSYGASIRRPDIAPILWALAAVLPITALGSIHTSRKLRDFGHRSIASRTIFANIVGGLAAVGAAFYGAGVWSLVVQRAVTETLNTALALHAFKWRPRFRFSFARLKSILGFSASIMATQLLVIMLIRVQDLFLGRTISAAAVGNYRIAWRVIELVAQSAIMPLVTVANVTLAKLQNDRPAFINAYLRMLGVGAMVALPAIIGFGILAPDVIVMLFGRQWEQSTLTAQVLSFMAVPFTMNYFAGPAFSALKKSGSIAKLGVVQFILTASATAISVHYGLVAVAASYVFRAYLTMPYQMWLLRKEAGIHYRETIRTVMPSLLASVLMAVILLPIQAHITDGITERPLRVAVDVVIGILLYTGGLFLFGKNFVRSQIGAVRPLLARRAGAV